MQGDVERAVQFFHRMQQENSALHLVLASPYEASQIRERYEMAGLAMDALIDVMTLPQQKDCRECEVDRGNYWRNGEPGVDPGESVFLMPGFCPMCGRMLTRPRDE